MDTSASTRRLPPSTLPRQPSSPKQQQQQQQHGVNILEQPQQRRPLNNINRDAPIVVGLGVDGLEDCATTSKTRHDGTKGGTNTSRSMTMPGRSLASRRSSSSSVSFSASRSAGISKISSNGNAAGHATSSSISHGSRAQMSGRDTAFTAVSDIRPIPLPTNAASSLNPSQQIRPFASTHSSASASLHDSASSAMSAPSPSRIRSLLSLLIPAALQAKLLPLTGVLPQHSPSLTSTSGHFSPQPQQPASRSLTRPRPAPRAPGQGSRQKTRAKRTFLIIMMIGAALVLVLRHRVDDLASYTRSTADKYVYDEKKDAPVLPRATTPAKHDVDRRPSHHFEPAVAVAAAGAPAAAAVHAAIPAAEPPILRDPKKDTVDDGSRALSPIEKEVQQKSKQKLKSDRDRERERDKDKKKKKAAAAAARAKKIKKAKQAKRAETYKQLLPLNEPARRHVYGANFQPAPPVHLRHDDDDDDNDEDGGEEEEEEEVDEASELSNLQVAQLPTPEILAQRFQEDKLKYEAQAPGWRAFEWDAPDAHESLLRTLETLTEDELALREWIRRLQLQSRARGVGLAADSSSSSAAHDADWDVLPEPPEQEIGGSEQKWTELLIELQDGDDGEGGGTGTGGKCDGATWLDKYKSLHGEILSGQRPPKFISYHCEHGMNCGGLGDRLLGMTSAFFFGLLTDRAFLAEWQTPIPLDVVFDSPALNWSFSSFASDDHPVLGQQALQEASADLDIVHFDRLSMDITFGRSTWNLPPPAKGKEVVLTPGFERRDLAYRSPWIKFFTNRGMMVRSFSYPHLRKRLSKLGLTRESAFACISRYLFRPKPSSMQLITQYTSVLALPTVFSVGIQIRTGDISMKDPVYDLENTVERHHPFFDCAQQLADTYAHPSQSVVYYLVTDSANLKQDALRVLGSRVIVTDMKPQHVHQKSGHADGVLGAVVEDWILAKTDMRVITQDSGFGKLASFASGKEQTTVTLWPQHNPDVAKLLSKKSHIKVDCTSPDAFSTFEDLASEWSLG